MVLWAADSVDSAGRAAGADSVAEVFTAAWAVALAADTAGEGTAECPLRPICAIGTIQKRSNLRADRRNLRLRL